MTNRHNVQQMRVEPKQALNYMGPERSLRRISPIGGLEKYKQRHWFLSSMPCQTLWQLSSNFVSEEITQWVRAFAELMWRHEFKSPALMHWVSNGHATVLWPHGGLPGLAETVSVRAGWETLSQCWRVMEQGTEVSSPSLCNSHPSHSHTQAKNN